MGAARRSHSRACDSAARGECDQTWHQRVPGRRRGAYLGPASRDGCRPGLGHRHRRGHNGFRARTAKSPWSRFDEHRAPARTLRKRTRRHHHQKHTRYWNDRRDSSRAATRRKSRRPAACSRFREVVMTGTTEKLRIVIADDERPARSFLASILRTFKDVEIVGEAANGMEAVHLIESRHPDLALLDLQMPEVDGLGVVRLLRKNRTPLVAFVTAYDEHAVRAFEVNAVDYVLKPVEAGRLRQTIDRVKDRLEREDFHSEETERIHAAAAVYEAEGGKTLQRIPVRRRDEIVLVP